MPAPKEMALIVGRVAFSELYIMYAVIPYRYLFCIVSRHGFSTLENRILLHERSVFKVMWVATFVAVMLGCVSNILAW